MRVNTSIKIDPTLWKEAKIQAIREDKTVSLGNVIIRGDNVILLIFPSEEKR